MTKRFNTDFISTDEAPLRMLLVSVNHSGFRFFVRLLRPTMYAHFLCPTLDEVAKEHDVIVCAIRRPEEVWQSWWNRGETDEDGSAPPEFYDCWRAMAEFAGRRPDTIFVSIDHPDRSLLLADLARNLQSPLLADWSMVVESSEQKSEAPAIDLSEIYKIPIVAKLYGGR